MQDHHTASLQHHRHYYEPSTGVAQGSRAAPPGMTPLGGEYSNPVGTGRTLSPAAARILNFGIFAAIAAIGIVVAFSLAH